MNFFTVSGAEFQPSFQRVSGKSLFLETCIITFACFSCIYSAFGQAQQLFPVGTNSPQTSFWLRTFQTLCLLHYPLCPFQFQTPQDTLTSQSHLLSWPLVLQCWLSQPVSQRSVPRSHFYLSMLGNDFTICQSHWKPHQLPTPPKRDAPRDSLSP